MTPVWPQLFELATIPNAFIDTLCCPKETSELTEFGCKNIALEITPPCFPEGKYQINSEHDIVIQTHQKSIANTNKALFHLQTQLSIDSIAIRKLL